MTRPSSGGSAAKYPFDLPPEVEAVWQELESGLTTYIAGLPTAAAGTDGRDRLHLEILSSSPEDRFPFVRLSAYGDGSRIRVTVSGDARMTAHTMHPRIKTSLRLRGWSGNDDSSTDWHRTRPVQNAAKLAKEIVLAMQSFGLPHPGLYTFRATGPSAASVADLLPLIPSEDIATEQAARDAAPAVAHTPTDRDHLVSLVRATIDGMVEGEPHVDGDGDFVIAHMGQPVFVRVEPDALSVRIFARLAHGVYSRRAAAVELAILNRNRRWETYSLDDRSIFLRSVVLAAPFAPGHLKGMLESFFLTMTATRDDLALRVRGEVA